MMLQKGLKSLQLSLNELIPRLSLDSLTVTNMAYSKARQKFKHTAFIELNRTAVVDVMYGDGDYQTLQGLRILAVDGSKVQLPDTPEIRDTFGILPYANPVHGIAGEHPFALASVLYDVLNRVALDAQLEPCRSYEVDLAASHLPHLQDDDLTIYDRGYCSFRMVALAMAAHGDFLIRCASGRFPQATVMLKGDGPDDITVELTAPAGFGADPNNQGLPAVTTVRLVRVVLDTGEIEVLVTSLLDQSRYPLAIFKEMYYLRWGVETFYGVVKTRLLLENFSGYSVEAIRQDFFSTIFLTGVESIFTGDAQAQLSREAAGHPKKVNKAVSFNAIKNRAFELFMSDQPDVEVLAALDELFLTNPTLVRGGRKPPRVRRGDSKVLGFWKRKRKGVY
jgi:hypothetical protein